MNTIHHFSNDCIHDLTASLEASAEAGIDPAFDAECEELERQFAELRLTFDHNSPERNPS
jgi:hypothetical protein